MAIYHYSESFICKSQGHSAVAAMAYQMGAKLKNERLGKIEDYSKKKGVVHSELLFPQNLPPWLADIELLNRTNPKMAAELLWNQIEKIESRKNAQYSRNANFALPVELTKEQCIALAKEYVQKAYIDKGMVATVSIHFDSKGNPHAHIMATLRNIEADGWGNKNRLWSSKEALYERRALLSEITNQHLKMAGFDKTIDHRSYKDQGTDLVPTIHEGPKRNPSNQQARIRNKQIRL